MAHISTAFPPAIPSSPTACFVWKTEKPYQDASRKSCDFSLLGAEWWLEAKCTRKSDGYYYYKITLNKNAGTVLERSHIDITIILQLYTGGSTRYGSFSYYHHQFPVQTQSELVFWEHEGSSLSSYFGCGYFGSYGAWKVICVFHDIPPPVLKVDDTKVDSSTQVDVVTSATADKGIQVSRDFSDTEKLSEDFSSLLRLSLYPDAWITGGDRTVPVHRSVLAARSPVFDTMFREASKDTLDLTDLDDNNTLDLFLEYAYSGTVRELSDDTAVSLYEAGHRYGMYSLRIACSNWMILHLTEENCVRFLDAASSSDDGPLQEAVASFLCDHPDVLKSPDWIKFAEEQQSLAYKLLYTYALRNL